MIPITHFDETTSWYQMAETARFWEQKARDAEEGYNTLLQDHTRLKAEFDDVTANAQRLADILEASPLAYQTHVREALDARPGESVARMRAQWQAEPFGGRASALAREIVIAVSVNPESIGGSRLARKIEAVIRQQVTGGE